MNLTERDKMRAVFFTAWQKHLTQQPIEPLEAQVIEIIFSHPEYHEFFANTDNLHTDNFVGTSPFLHLSLHLSIREQISTNRPRGIKEIYHALCKKLNDAHAAEHTMLECLGQVLWDAQNSGKIPSEEIYLEKLKKL